MKITSSTVIAMLAAVAIPEAVHSMSMEDYGVTKSECETQGGIVVADLTGEVMDPEYKCANTNENPTDWIVPAEGEPWPEEFEVCCGGTGDGDEWDWSYEDYYFITTQECSDFYDGTIEQDNGNANYACSTDGFPPISNVTSTGDATGESLGVCCLKPWIITNQDCADEFEGNVVQDSGDGAVFKEDYICASDGYPPIGNVTTSEGSAPTGVCCMKPWTLTKEECEDLLQGTVVTDSGNGAVFAPDYMCTGNFPPAGQIAESDSATPTGICCVDFGFEWGAVTKSARPMSIVKKANAKAHKKAHTKSSAKKSHQLRGPFW